MNSKDRDGVKDKLKQLQKMTWQDLYNNTGKGENARGFNLEKIKGQQTHEGHQVFSIRLNSKLRARVFRVGDTMIVISLHSDHDSTYDHPGGDVTEPLPTRPPLGEDVDES